MNNKTRKIIRVGNSLGITIPSEIIEKQQFKKDDIFNVELDENGNIVLSPVKKALPEGLRPEVLNMAHKLMGKYSEALKGLQDR
ncbi:AbrB/MazE/SpoVT family DNA-binding domain-containing protein [Paenibacillus koleovorans]|uniref:AbrB/MazE/SpoVT family DNA-binding domain-containing protein n=1 Tax=Paenibacillus koleovorans TaxID=121608 RepID=UPI0013E3401C|nr:AbrB/MazE/SpoVT family DNA-binding domain-containing protein [Paenibacillus koleovorans]